MLHARVVENGAAASGKTVSFQLLRGQGTLSTSSVTSNSLGDVSSTLTVTSLSSQISVGACVPSTSACTTFNVFPVAETGLVLQKISGDGQYAAPGGSFAPVMVRVVDSSIPDKPVLGVPVVFHVTALRAQGQSAPALDGEVLSGRFAGGVVVSSSDNAVLSNAQGMASLAATAPANEPALQINVQASAAGISQSFTLHSWAGTSLAATLAQLGSDAGGTAATSQTQLAVTGTALLAARKSSVESSVESPAMLVAVPEISSTTMLSTGLPAVTTPSSTIQNSSNKATAIMAGHAAAPGTPPGMTIQAMPEHIWLAAGTSTAMLTARVLRNGEPAAGQAVRFQASGGAQLSRTSAFTNADGEASVVISTSGVTTQGLTTDGIQSNVRVKACLLPDSTSCATFLLSVTPDGITSSNTNPPTHSLSCTTTDCSGASAPSDPHPGNTASSTGPSGAAK